MSRRRRNPALSDVNTLLILGGVGVVIYMLYRVYGAGKSVVAAAGQAQQAAGSKVADILEYIFPHAVKLGQFAPNSTIVLPDQTEITSDLASGVGQFTATDGTQQIQFVFGGQTYRTAASPDETNTYYAFAANTPAATITAGTTPPAGPDWTTMYPGGA